ncbi:MAG: S9 family peptidase [Bacteroides sp.]|nr:S9 family peptidase [Bacteroides sp.]
MKFINLFVLCLLSAICSEGVAQNPTTESIAKAVTSSVKSEQSHNFDILSKKLDDILWFDNVGDIAYIDKVRLAGPPNPHRKPNGNEFHDSLLDNDFIFYSYIFIPKKVKQDEKYPLVVLVHGGIHSSFSWVFSHFVRELLSQGYIIVAPDYRGSTGYGKNFYNSIDYGGLENDDVLAATNYMIENYSIVDPKRVGLLGWSHGGMITLMNSCNHPEVYACGYAGVPVSDVTYRLEYREPSYTKNFTASYHIGKTPQEDPEEYARRSPVNHAKKLRIPLMITTTENDDDVSYLEVKRMIDSLQHHGKDFEYKIYPPKAGAHLFERIDTKEATDIRYNAYKFLDKYLKPENPFNSPAEMRKAGYRFN